MSDCENLPPRRPFDAATILLHWLSVALIAALGASGLAFAAIVGPPPAALLWIHRTAGASLWSLTFLRLIWRSTFARFPPFPDDQWRIQRAWTVVSERALYVLLIFQPLSGVATSLLLGRPFAIFEFEVPALLQRNLALWQVSFLVHRCGAIALFALVAFHAGNVLLRHYFLRSDVLAAMAPWLSTRALYRRRT